MAVVHKVHKKIAAIHSGNFMIAEFEPNDPDGDEFGPAPPNKIPSKPKPLSKEDPGLNSNLIVPENNKIVDEIKEEEKVDLAEEVVLPFRPIIRRHLIKHNENHITISTECNAHIKQIPLTG